MQLLYYKLLGCAVQFCSHFCKAFSCVINYSKGPQPFEAHRLFLKKNTHLTRGRAGDAQNAPEQARYLHSPQNKWARRKKAAPIQTGKPLHPTKCNKKANRKRGQRSLGAYTGDPRTRMIRRKEYTPLKGRMKNIWHLHVFPTPVWLILPAQILSYAQ